MSINANHARKGKSQAAYALDNLTYVLNGKHFPKVCCCCDRFILFGEEDFVNETFFENEKIRKAMSKTSVDLTSNSGDYHLSDEAKNMILDYYTVKPSIVGQDDWNMLKELYLSPRSYRRTTGTTRRSRFELGICKQCKTTMVCIKKQGIASVKPGYTFISNGRMFGPSPAELSSLTETELALVSLARVDHHVLSFQGGPHQAITGWHSMFANDVSLVMRTMNWCKTNTEEDSSAINDDNNTSMDDDSSDDGQRNPGSATETVPEETEPMEEREEQRRPKLASICIILEGPFTPRQKAIVKRKTKVRQGKIREALEWLKANNHLYAAIDISEDDIEDPIVIDSSRLVPTEMNNIETVYQMEAIFPDTSNADKSNGGFDNSDEFTNESLEQMLMRADGRKATLIARPTNNRLQDYQGDNLLRAFPLQFPYGIGARDAEGEYRGGVLHYRHLSFMSILSFQTAVFVCVLHNMFERQRMLSHSYYTRLETEYSNYSDITAESMSDAIDRYANRVSGNAAADKFLKRCHAVTAAMAHTGAAAEKARTQMCALIARLGLPAIMFTICPLDRFSFRIVIYAHMENGFDGIPQGNSDAEPVREFVVNMDKIVNEYPGLVAMEYENVISIVVRHILGYDMKEGINILDEGLFGDVEACCPCTEEQGRKTLHAHILVWLKDWSKLLDALGSEHGRTRNIASTTLAKFCSSVQTTEIFGCDEHSIATPCVQGCSVGSVGISNFETCTKQDLRELRTLTGTTSLGGKSILRCKTCGYPYTSEDFAVAALEKHFSREAIYCEGNRPTYKQDFWEKGGNIPKARLEMELYVMRQSEPHRVQRRPNGLYHISRKERECIGFKQNLHKTQHTKACFKKGCECRMKLPQPPQQRTMVFFNEKETNWFLWNGENKKKKLFYVAQKRGKADCFANMHNNDVTELLKCNNNMVTGVDGGSAMYVTCYTSKSTKDEDSKKATEAAKRMIKKMNQELEKMNKANEELAGEGIMPDEIDYAKTGLMTLIRSVFMLLNTHVVGAPMASFLTRNQSRFWFSHEFAYVNLEDYFKAIASDFQLGQTQDGSVYIKTCVLNYTMRPGHLDDICLYGFLEQYCVAPKSKDSWEWMGDHPSRSRMAVKSRKQRQIPLITHRSFIDTKDFNGLNILQCEWPVEDTAIREAMEKYARSVCVCFVPFRKSEDLQREGSYVLRMRNFALSEEYQTILQNIQNVRNSLNSGRPIDILERETQKPKETSDETVDTDEDNNQQNEAFDLLVDESMTIGEFPCPKYRVAGVLNFKSNIVTGLGRHRCGSRFIRTPTVEIPPAGHLSAPAPVSNMANENENYTYFSGSNTPLPLPLHVLVTEETIQTFDPRWGKNVPKAIGTLPNIRQYASAVFGNDEDQKKAFECLAADFCLRVREMAQDDEYDDVIAAAPTLRQSKRRRINDIMKPLRGVNHKGQFICFLSGFGGSGKSHVLKAHVRYCSSFCKNIGMKFNRRTIVVTAMTGSAAVSINGETAHSAALWNSRMVTRAARQAYKYTVQFVLDECSFANCENFVRNELRLRQLTERSSEPYGGLSIIYAGDMSQLKPVYGNPIYLDREFELWKGVHTFLELRTSHRFNDDIPWGNLLGRFRDNGPSVNDVDLINERQIGSENGPTEDDLPPDITYAVKNNLDRAAINDGIFASHLKQTHFKSQNILPPKHTIIVRASDVEWHRGNDEYVAMNQEALDIFYACCGDGNVKSRKGSKYYDPFMKLYYKRRVMLSENIDVGNGVANGTMCEFEGIVFKEGVDYDQLEKVVIDDYYVWTISVPQIDSIKLRILDGLQDENEIRFHYLKPVQVSVCVHYPMPLAPDVDRNTDRIWRNVRMKCFQLNVADARTIHKLQGRSITNLLISVWDYTGNWIYVALSRVKTRAGLFLRLPLDFNKCRGMSEELLSWLNDMRKRTPPSEPDSDYVV